MPRTRAGSRPPKRHRAAVVEGFDCAGGLISGQLCAVVEAWECRGGLASAAAAVEGFQCQGRIQGLAEVVEGFQCQGFLQVSGSAPTYPNGYKHYLPLMIDGDQITGTAVLSNLVLLIDDTFPDLATVANGGKSESSGKDILLTLDNDAVLDFRVDTWNSSTGRFVTLYRLPTATPGVRTMLRLYVGKAGVATSPANPAGVYAAYLAAWDCRTGEDLTGQGRTMTPTDVGVGSAIGDAGSFNGTTSKLARSSLLPANGLTSFSIEAIVKPASRGNMGIFVSGPAAAPDETAMGLQLEYQDPGIASGEANTVIFKVTIQPGGSPPPAPVAARVEAEAESQSPIGVVQYLVGRWSSGSVASLIINGVIAVPSNTPVPRSGTTLIERG